MSAIGKDELIISCADAYKTASGTTDGVKAGELAAKIAGLSSGNAKGILFEEINESGKPEKIKLSGVTRFTNYQFAIPIYTSVKTFELKDSPITAIPQNCFSGCTALENIDNIIANSTSFAKSCFQLCKGLTKVTFTLTPTTLESSSFSSCTNITEIRVPWSEGAVAGAPWAATNATIIYDFNG